MKDRAMNDRALFKMAASSLIIAGAMVGCSGATLNDHAETHASKIAKMAAAQADEAEKALKKGNAGRAIASAEAAVAAEPENASWRTLLGRAYLRAGRYESAGTAFEDALTLGSREPRAIVNLALVRTALGRKESARDLLQDKMDALSAADYGLAMAMAGDPDEAIRILSQAIHDSGATAKERQNLAYAYALSGQWVQARHMASFDLTPQDAARRVANWAQMVQPEGERARVIAMIGVQPDADDAGLPVRLALGQKTDTPVRLADASPEALQQAAAESMIAAVNADDRSYAPLPAPVTPMRQASVNQSVEAALSPTPFRRSNLAVHPAVAGTTRLPASRPAGGWSPVDPIRGSSWVVQLGAFSSPAAARASRVYFLKRHETVQGFPMIDSDVAMNGRSLYRVAVAGFGDRGAADRFCSELKAGGGSCFVRMGGAEAAPSRWAAAIKAMKPRQMAMRGKL